MVEHPDRLVHLTALVDGQPVADDDQPGTPGRLRRLCATVTQVLPATWAGLSLAEDGKVSGAMTGLRRPRAEARGPPVHPWGRSLRRLRADPPSGAGAGPRRLRRPPLAGVRPAAHERGIRGVYAFPLQIGVACLGALDVYRDRVEPVSADAIDDGQTFADIALTMLVSDEPLSPSDVGIARSTTCSSRHACLPGARHGDGRPGCQSRRSPGETPRARLRRGTTGGPGRPRRRRRTPAVGSLVVEPAVPDRLGEPEGSPA